LRLRILLTIQVRRVKCGEERPACKRCATTGRECQYDHSPPPAWQVIVAPLHFTERECRSLDFYRDQTVSHISSFFPTKFWSNDIPQIAHSELSIRHALFSIAGFHEQFVLGKDAKSKECQYGLVHYNLAIKELFKADSPHVSPATALLCCLLFISIEVKVLLIFWLGLY
jgi:hypothetical protein